MFGQNVGAVQHAVRARQAQLRKLAAVKSRGPVVHAVQRYPTVWVSVPRAVAADYWLPWADVVDAAEQGRDGLAVVTERPRFWGGRAGERPPNPPDVAYLAEGQDDWRGRTVLYQQNC